MLDGEDIAAQLTLEWKTLQDTPEKARAHGLLVECDTPQLASDVRTTLMQQDRYNGNEYNDAANLLTQALKEVVRKPNATATLPKGLSKEEIAFAKADAQSRKDFATTFAKTFPNGIKIEPGDMPLIFVHFGGLVVIPLPTPPAPPQKAPDRVMDI
ncbi:MAG: hypothetical protein V4735_00855 [Pseudomonadota bacterium]